MDGDSVKELVIAVTCSNQDDKKIPIDQSITRIFDFFVYRLNMSLQIALLSKLMVTLIARIFDFFMNRLNMSLQISQSRSLMIT